MRCASCSGDPWGNPIAPACRMQTSGHFWCQSSGTAAALRQDPTALLSRSFVPPFWTQGGTAFANTYMESIGVLDAANRNAAGHNAAMPVRGRSGLCNGSN